MDCDNREDVVTIRKSVYDSLIAKDVISTIRGFIWIKLELARWHSTRKLQT